MQPSVVIITGAASGIGRHMATVLAAQKDRYRVAAADINIEALRLTFVPDDALQIYRLDIRAPEQWRQLISSTLDQFGRIDYLFNIAGGGRLGFFLDQPLENFDYVIDLNLKGPLYGMRLVAEVMARQGAGHIINVASLAGVAPTPGNALYSAAKSGLRAASLAAAVSLRRRGVFVTVIAPDVVDTPALRQHFENPEAAALIHSGPRPLPVTAVEKAFVRAMRDKPLEINLPAWRGWLAKINNLYPPLMFRLYGSLSRRGRKRLAENQKRYHD